MTCTFASILQLRESIRFCSQKPVPCTFSSIQQPRESIRFVSRNPCRVSSLQYNNHVCSQKPVTCTFASIQQPRESIRFVSRNPCRVPSLQYNNHVNRFVFVSRNPCRVPSLQYYNHVNRFVFVSMHSLLLMHVHIISVSFSKTLFSNSTIFGIFVLLPQFILVVKKTNEKAHGMCKRGIVIAYII